MNVQTTNQVRQWISPITWTKYILNFRDRPPSSIWRNSIGWAWSVTLQQTVYWPHLWPICWFTGGITHPTEFSEGSAHSPKRSLTRLASFSLLEILVVIWALATRPIRSMSCWSIEWMVRNIKVYTIASGRFHILAVSAAKSLAVNLAQSLSALHSYIIIAIARVGWRHILRKEDDWTFGSSQSMLLLAMVIIEVDVGLISCSCGAVEPRLFCCRLIGHCVLGALALLDADVEKGRTEHYHFKSDSCRRWDKLNQPFLS